MKRMIMFLLVISVFLFGAGCSRQSESVESNQDISLVPEASTGVDPDPVESVAPEADTPELDTSITAAPEEQSELVMPQPATDYVSDEMYANAILNEGNLARLAAVMKKAREGEEITVAVIGGSITQGSSAAWGNAYADHFYNWWLQAFPETKVNFVNAGIGATTSYLGVHRADTDLLSHNPDVVVIEFSVNDTETLLYKESYEDLIRKIMKQENNPAILQLFMTMEDGTSAQNIHMHLGFWYDLPRISYREAVLKEIEKGTFVWKDISPDNIHPNDKGHAIVGEILWNYLNSVYARLDTITEEVTPLTKEPFFDEAYIDATILDSTNLEPVILGSFVKEKVFDRFPNGWRTTTGEESIVFETEAQNIGIMFYRTVDGKSGRYEVYVDGELVRTLDGDFTGGWGNYAETIEVYKSDEKKMHRIEIKKAVDSTGDVFSILGLLIS